LNHDGYLPEFVSITDGKCADATILTSGATQTNFRCCES
jgi:hypothetical protein